jgi:hypothetical protein
MKTSGAISSPRSKTAPAANLPAKPIVCKARKVSFRLVLREVDETEMEKNPHQVLEELIQRELAKLPEREAPTTLIPRVLAEIQARARKHWWQRPWTHWPRSLQLVSLPFMIASAGAAVAGVSLTWNFIASNWSVDSASETMGRLGDAWDILSVLGNAVLMLGRAAGQEWLLLALCIPLSMYLACVGLGTLCYRTAFYHR